MEFNKQKELLDRLQRLADLVTEKNEEIQKLRVALAESNTMLKVMADKATEVTEKEKSAEEEVKFYQSLELKINCDMEERDAEFQEKWEIFNQEKNEFNAERDNFKKEKKELEDLKSEFALQEKQINLAMILMCVYFGLAWLQAGLWVDLLQIGQWLGGIFKAGEWIIGNLGIQATVLRISFERIIPVIIIAAVIGVVGYAFYRLQEYWEQESLYVTYAAGYVAMMIGNWIEQINSAAAFILIEVIYVLIRIRREKY